MKKYKSVIIRNLCKKTSLLLSILIIIGVLTGCDSPETCNYCDTRVDEPVEIVPLIASLVNADVDEVTGTFSYKGDKYSDRGPYGREYTIKLCDYHIESLSKFITTNKELFLLNTTYWENGFITVDEVKMDDHQFSATISFHGEYIPDSFTDAVIGLEYTQKKAVLTSEDNIDISTSSRMVQDPKYVTNISDNQKQFVYDRPDDMKYSSGLLALENVSYPVAIFIGKASAFPGNVSIGAMLNEPNGKYFFLQATGEVFSIRWKADY